MITFVLHDSLSYGSAEDAAMMGLQAEAAQLFYDFHLDVHVPGDHPQYCIDGLDPEAYLADVIDRLAKGHPVNRLSELLPWNWKRQDAIRKAA